MTRTRSAAPQVPVAVVGMGAMLPGGRNLTECWRAIVTGRDLMTDIPADRWPIEDHYSPEPGAPDRTYGRRGAFLPDVEFDPQRYGIPPNAMPATDTSQLLALMVADQVLADCAETMPADRERVGVVLGSSWLQLVVDASARLQRSVWYRAMRREGISARQAEAACDAIAGSYVPWQEETFPGLLTNVISGRIANRFDLHGINHTTDAACAGSLAALYTAIAELSLGRSDVVLTGGVDTMNDPTMFTCFSQTPALSRSGEIRPFSDTADGTLLGEGVVMFALKRLDAAERSGDRVYAVIRGIGAASDGRGPVVFAASSAGQIRALRRAYEAAGYGPETVEMVEAHGTGTKAGDAAEFAALREVFDDSGRGDRQWCALGSAKSQFGHTKATAGAAGLLKAILALNEQILPATIKVDQPNPALELDNSPFYLNTRARAWIHTAEYPRRAAVSSFGFGGSNFHVTLEEYRAPARSRARRAAPLPVGPQLFMFSAASPEELSQRLDTLAFDRPPGDLAADSCRQFRSDDMVRLAVVGRDVDDLRAGLTQARPLIRQSKAFSAGGLHLGVDTSQPGRIGFLFPGQGSQYPGMSGDLAMHLTAAQHVWDRAARLPLGEAGAGVLAEVVCGPDMFTNEQRRAQRDRLTATEWAQPALAVHSAALLTILDELGVRPDALAGHSFGELTALHAAGVYDVDTLVTLARKRGELMRDAASTPGAMLAVSIPIDELDPILDRVGNVWLANHNSPTQVVLAGTRAAVGTVEDLMLDRGVRVTRLNTAAAFHSPLVASAEQPLREFLHECRLQAPTRDVYAGADATRYSSDPDDIRRRLAAQLAEPVRFVDVVETMYTGGVRTFVEVGPGAVLSGLTARILGERDHTAIPLDRKGRHGVEALLDGVGRLAVSGVAVNFAALETAEHSPGDRLAAQSAGRMTITINGGNYGRPASVRASETTAAGPTTTPE